MLERFRTIGLRIDRSGKLWHQGEEVTHPRLRQALLRWLDVSPDGRDIVRLDAQRYAYVEVEDAHLRVTSARWDGDRAWLLLDDGSEEELAYDSLESSADDAAYCRVRGGRLRARLTTPAYYTLAERIVEGPEGFVLQAAGAQHPVRRNG